MPRSRTTSSTNGSSSTSTNTSTIANRRPRSNVDVVAIAERLAAQRVLWRPLATFDPAQRHYERLAAEPDFEAWVLTWLPGQGTEWHDHGGSAGVFTVLEGRLSERTATVGSGHRFEDGPVIDPGRRALDAGAIRPFGSRHLHRVTNDHLRPAVSLHVYAPALTEMHEYTAVGDRLRLSSSRLAGANW